MKTKSKYDAYDLQKQGNGAQLFISRNGNFFHCYNQCAHLIAHIMGYAILYSKSPFHDEGTVRVGFPFGCMTKVIEAVEKRYPTIKCTKQEIDLCVFEITAPTQLPIVEVPDNVYENGLTDTLMMKILNLDMENTSPMQAFNFIAKLKEECKKTLNMK